MINPSFIMAVIYLIPIVLNSTCFDSSISFSRSRGGLIARIHNAGLNGINLLWKRIGRESCDDGNSGTVFSDPGSLLKQLAARSYWRPAMSTR
jgi:hypothetical protein